MTPGRSPSPMWTPVTVWQVPTGALTGAADAMTLVFQGAPPDAYSAVVTVGKSPSC
jgi:hypothetical protein